MWVGTEGAGWWLRTVGGERWQLAGLPEQTVYQIKALTAPITSSTYLLAATDQGLFRARPVLEE